MCEQIVSSALYAAHDPSARISPEWVEAMVAFLDSKIPVKECSFHDTEGRSVGPGPFDRLRDDIRCRWWKTRGRRVLAGDVFPEAL